MKKYNMDSSEEDIVRALQEGGYLAGLNPTTEQPIFQKYLISLLNRKSSSEMAGTLSSLQNQLKIFEKSSSKATNIISRWTIVMAGATVLLAIATFVDVFGRIG